MRYIKLLIIGILTFALAICCSCGKETSAVTEEQPTEHQFILFTMQNGETFKVETYPEYAPETCNNFIRLVNEGFYNGLTFHRVIDNFMAQGGDPEGTGSGISEGSIHGEFASNGFNQNTLSHQRGVVSMARSNNPDSAYSQFFICYSDCSYLDGNYAAFAKVVDGMETVDNFLKVERRMGSDGSVSSPVTPIVIESAVVVDD